MSGTRSQVVFLMVVGLGLLAQPALSQTINANQPTLPSPGWYVPPPYRNMAEFLATNSDLVVIGTVTSAVEGQRGFIRIPELLKLPVTEVQMTVDEVLFGVAPANTLEITLSDRSYNLQPGDRILAWGTYVVEDNWRLRGRGRRVEGDELYGRAHEPAFECGTRRVEVDSLSAVRRDLVSVRHNSTVFNGNRTIALGRLRGSSRWSPAGAVYEVDSLGWVMGQGEAVPRRLEFPPVPGCSPGIMPGDSLLIPLPPGFRGGTLRLLECPTALRVKNAFVPGLGVPLNKVYQAIDTVGLMLKLRPMQLKEN